MEELEKEVAEQKVQDPRAVARKVGPVIRHGRR